MKTKTKTSRRSKPKHKLKSFRKLPSTARKQPANNQPPSTTENPFHSAGQGLPLFGRYDFARRKRLKPQA